MIMLCRKTLQEGSMKSSFLAMIERGKTQHVIKACLEMNDIFFFTDSLLMKGSFKE